MTHTAPPAGPTAGPLTGPPTDPPTGQPGSDPVPLRNNRDFKWFLVARGFSTSGFQILAISIGWHVYALTGEVFYLGLIGLFMFLPFLAFFLFAGLASDRYDRRHIVCICSVVEAMAVLLIGVVLMQTTMSVWAIFGLLLVTATAQAFLHPAMQAIVPNLVPRDQLASAIATQTAVMKAAQLGGPALGGLILAVIDTRIYLLVAVLFLLAAFAAWSIRTRLRVAGREPFSLNVIFGGFRHIWRTKPVLGAVSIDLVAVLFGGVMGLLPVFASDILQVGPETLGIMRAAPAVGALLVSVLLARFGMRWRLGPAFFLSLAVFGVSIIAFSLSQTLWLSLIALTAYGASDMVSVYVRQTLVQIETPDALRGRVSAVNSVAINASNQLGDFRGGMMAAVTGAPAAVLIGGGVVLGFAALWWRLFPDLRALDRF